MYRMVPISCAATTNSMFFMLGFVGGLSDVVVRSAVGLTLVMGVVFVLTARLLVVMGRLKMVSRGGGRG